MTVCNPPGLRGIARRAKSSAIRVPIVASGDRRAPLRVYP